MAPGTKADLDLMDLDLQSEMQLNRAKASWIVLNYPRVFIRPIHSGADQALSGKPSVRVQLVMPD